MEDGEAVGQHRQVDIQVVVVDQTQHQGCVGGMLASLLGLRAGLQLQLGYQFLSGGYALVEYFWKPGRKIVSTA